MRPAEAVQSVVDAWEDLDASQLFGLFVPDGVYDDPLKEARLSGPEAIRDGNAESMRELSSCRITLTHLVEHGSTAFAEGRFVADLAGGGGTIDFPFALVAELAEGKIRRLAEYFDTRPLVGG